MMYKSLIKIICLSLLFNVTLLAQFGKNKVQYKDFTWYYIQTNHFDIYFSQQGASLTEFAAQASEDALASIQGSFNYRINNRITLIIYNSTNDFQETNVIDQYLTEGIEGFTELFKNRVVVQFMGSYKKFRHLIHHELVHAVMNDMFYGGSLQNVISNSITINIPQWFSEGMAEYQALGWDVDTDMFIRDAAISGYLPDINNLQGYFAYRGGQSVFYYISEKYGKEKIGELINKVKGSGSVEEGMKNSIGLDLEELSERWKKEIKKTYWPDIALRKDPDEFSKRLTDHREDGGFYNTSPALSPQGDKIAFLSNRDVYFDVFLMDAIDGKIIKKLVRGNRSADFEELNILTPGLTWSPDGKRIALSAKSSGWDVIYLIDIDSEERETLPVRLEGIRSVIWSPDGDKISFIGHTSRQSDIYLYNLVTKEMKNLTDDIFTDLDPIWSPDGKSIYFSSDRNENLSSAALPDSFKIYNYNYNQLDIYSLDVSSRVITRITDMPESDETSPVPGPDGKEILFISDVNGINNIYAMSLNYNSAENTQDYSPVSNSLSGLYQLSTSKDGKKLTYSTLYQSSFNIFLMNNPFETKLDSIYFLPTVYIERLKKGPEGLFSVERKDTVSADTSLFYTGQVEDTTNIYGDSVKIDFNNYIFGEATFNMPDTNITDRELFNPADNLDEEGNYRVNKYKISFSPDLIYANAGYSSLYGLLGTTVISFSDVLGNHRLIGLTSLQIDLKNSDYGLAYFYLPDRINYGIEGFHTARFVFLQRGFRDYLYRFRNFGAVFSMSYPLSRFYRVDGAMSWLNVSQDNLDDPNETSQKIDYVIPALSFIHDNVLYGYTSPVDGTRYRFDVLGNPGITGRDYSFYSALGDYRTYFLFGTDYSFAFRLSGGISGGNNPQRFFIGGIENWINRRFASGGIPLESASDFAFLTAALPLRGFDYAERIGTKYGLMNMEFRFPLIKYLVTGALPILFSNIIGTAFIDVGTAWTNNDELRFFERNMNNNVVAKDLLMGTGFGARIFFLYFLLRFDVAWAYTVDGFSSARFYFSLGADF